jgi:hypothetical protein
MPKISGRGLVRYFYIKYLFGIKKCLKCRWAGKNAGSFQLEKPSAYFVHCLRYNEAIKQNIVLVAGRCQINLVENAE